MKAIIIEPDTLIRQHLPSHDCEFLVAENTRQARSLLEKETVSLVICDASSADQDLLALIRQSRDNVFKDYVFILIVIDFLNQAELLSRLVQAGADDFLGRPVRPEELRQKLRLAERVVSLENRRRQTGPDRTAWQLDSLLTRLLPGILHEINNPVGFVSSNLSTLPAYFDTVLEQFRRYEELVLLLEKDHSLPTPEQKAVADCRAFYEDNDLSFLKTDIVSLISESREGMERIRKLVQDLGKVVQADNPDDKTNIVDIDLTDCLDSALNIVWYQLKYKAVIKKSGRSLSLRLPGGSSDKLIYAFLMVLEHLARLIESSGEISIDTSVQADRAMVQIGATGCGSHDKMTETRPEHPGMIMARDIFHNYEGALEVIREDAGSIRFMVTFPVSIRKE
ncbi:MAG: hypothetical protein R6U29_12525 [Desulfosudaceae bacterium]